MNLNFLGPVLAMARGSKPAAPSETQSAPLSSTPLTPATATEREQILKAVEEFFPGKRLSPGGNIYELEESSPAPDETLISISRALPPLATEEECAELRRLQSEYQRGLEHLDAVGKDRIRDAHARHVKEIGARILAGEDVADGWSREEIATDFAARRSGLKRAIGERSLAAARIVALIAGRFIEHGRKHTENLIVLDYTNYRTFGIPYAPSGLIRTLRSAMCRAERIAGAVERAEEMASLGGLGGSPASKCAPFGISLDAPEPAQP
jgi:hypothetical protein